MKNSDVTYTYDHFGYMMQYKRHKIGGAGVLKRGRKIPSNLTFYRDQAEVEKRNILNGQLGRFKNIITEIDQKEAV